MKYRLTFLFLWLLLILTACGGNARPISGSFGESDLHFEVNGHTFELNSDVKPMLAILGDGYIFSEAPSCLYDGTDKTYEYPGLSIYTYPLDQKDCIDEIILTDNNYKTSKGITAGSTLENITAVYGNNYKDEDGIITYRMEPDNIKSPCLYFVIDGGQATSISYYSASNIE